MGNFDDIEDKAEVSLSDNVDVDLPNEAVNRKKQLRSTKWQTYLTADEAADITATMKPLEKPSDRIRRLLLADTKRRLKKRG